MNPHSLHHPSPLTLPPLQFVLYMFVGLAIVCDEYFVPALEVIAGSTKWNLSNDIAGATLMAAGGSAPELFTSLVGTFKESSVGFGTIVGSAVFNVMFVIGVCATASSKPLSLNWWPLFRDCTYYAICLFILAFFMRDSVIEMYESIVLLVLYIGYVLVMKYNKDLYGWLLAKVLKKDSVTITLLMAELEDDEEVSFSDFQFQFICSCRATFERTFPCPFFRPISLFILFILFILPPPFNLSSSTGHPLLFLRFSKRFLSPFLLLSSFPAAGALFLLFLFPLSFLLSLSLFVSLFLSLSLSPLSSL